MKLGYFYHVPALMKSDGLYMPGYQAALVDKLAEYCEQVVCFLPSPSPSEISLMDSKIKSGNVVFYDLGEHRRAFFQIVFSSAIAARAKPRLKEIDLLLLRGPSPLLSAMAHQAAGKPLSLLLVGHYDKGIGDLPYFKKKMIMWWSRINRKQQDRLCRKALTFVNNRQLFNELQGAAPHLFEVRTSTFCESDFFNRDDTCQGKTFRLLYTGRMDAAKGIEDILEALIILVRKKNDVRLDLVGPEQPRDPVLKRILRRAAEAGVQERVCYHGSVPVGDKLWEFYRKSDIYVIASRFSFEGFPRTIWEAFSQSLPVVAANAGSIVDYAEKAVSLVPPCNPDAIAKAVQELLSDSESRKRLIKAGRELAVESAMENQVKRMVSRMEWWAHQKTV